MLHTSKLKAFVEARTGENQDLDLIFKVCLATTGIASLSVPELRAASY